MLQKEYEFSQSQFSEPFVRGSNTSGLCNPFLQFFPWMVRPEGQLTLVIQVHFSCEGMGSNFYFEVVGKSLFEVTGDPTNIVVHDIYDMYAKAIEDIRAFLDYKTGENGVSTIGVSMPALEDVLDEIVKFVTVLHSRK